MWHRIELNPDGSVASCTEVESAGQNGKLVVYVEADDRAKACEEALAWRT